MVLVFAALLVACDDDDSSDPTATPTPAATTASGTPTAGATAPAEQATPGAVSSLQDVKAAVVRIVAQGSFVDPELGERVNAAGSGSGFIIDPSGIAVTNNHVVTGAAFIQVFVGGDDEPRNARVLGVSECSDLAVIDIDGEGYPFLEWVAGELRVGTDVFVAGFPLGDPEFTLTRGIISKERADGESNWASVDSVIEHDAAVNPGNSGGPLVNADGLVVGVNYASSFAGQSFAISRVEALSVIEQLRSGADVHSIGINGEAVVSETDNTSGIWVASVESGSPADRVGIEAGDIITRLEGLVLSTDGTMADYCDILRSNTAEDVMAIEVLRFSTGEVLEGRLNGPPLELSFSFRQELDEVTADDDGAAPTAEYTDYVTVTDDTQAIAVEVPAEWSDLDGQFEEGFGPSIVAAPSVSSFNDTWTTPGVVVTASDILVGSELDELLDILADGLDCSETVRRDYSDPFYTGRYAVLEDCGGTDTEVILVAATPEDGGFVILVLVQVVTEADLGALDRILDSFVVVSDF